MNHNARFGEPSVRNRQSSETNLGSVRIEIHEPRYFYSTADLPKHVSESRFAIRIGAQSAMGAGSVSQLTSIRDQLKACLSDARPEATSEAPPIACDLAEQIRALKESHTIEGASNRIGKR